MLPHVNWGDLFFDLFYVAAAYNLGVLLMSAMSDSRQWLRGVIYYLGTFGPLWGTWEVSMFYESRYTSVDYAHRMFEVVRYLFVSTAVVHVKPLELLGDL
jgi:low temperature requirement protein LtrA